MKVFLAIILVISSSWLICSAHEVSPSMTTINSNSTSQTFGESKVVNQQCTCRGQSLCGKDSIIVRTYLPSPSPSPIDPRRRQRIAMIVTNTCPFCAADLITLDCSSFLPKNLLFPYCAVNNGRPLAPKTSWLTYFQGTLLDVIPVLQANFYCTT